MTKWRRNPKVDANQPAIVEALRGVPGISVKTGVDDILVGYKGRDYWYEIKNPATVSKKKKKVRESAIKDSQKSLKAEWCGHYRIVWKVEQILEDLGLL